MEGKQPLVIFLDQMRLQAAANEASIKSWDFPKELVSDGKILNRPEFAIQLVKFLTTARVGTNPIVLVLSESVCFSHTIKAEEITEKEQHARNFYDMVPLETATKREYEIGRDILLVAADSEFVKTIMEALMKYGCTIGAVVPAQVLPEVGAKRWLDAQYVQYIAKNASGLPRWSLLSQDKGEVHTEEPEKELGPKKNKPPYGLIAVFAVLVVILVLLLIFRKP